MLGEEELRKLQEDVQLNSKRASTAIVDIWNLSNNIEEAKGLLTKEDTLLRRELEDFKEEVAKDQNQNKIRENQVEAVIVELSEELSDAQTQNQAQINVINTELDSLEASINKVSSETAEIRKLIEDIETPKEAEYIDDFDRRMKLFMEEMKTFRGEWQRQWDAAQKVEVPWRWIDNFGAFYNGVYHGQTRRLNGETVPDGVGRWTDSEDQYDFTIEGEWKEGKLDGKAIITLPKSDFEEEWKDGKLNGRSLEYFNSGGRE